MIYPRLRSLFGDVRVQMRQNPARQPRFDPIRLDASPQRAVIKALRSAAR